MRGVNMDRRKRKTRKAIQAACIELIREKGFDSISVLDITERADINRGTFYLHFVDKYDMIDQFEAELIEKIEQAINEHSLNTNTLNDLIISRYKPLVKIFDCFQEDREILEILFQTKGVLEIQNRFEEILHTVFEYNVKEQIKYNNNAIPEIFLSLIASILIGIANYWILGNKKITSEELALGLLTVSINGPAKVAGLIPGDIIELKEMIEETSKEKGKDENQ